jgi:hypothetical protein
MDCGCGCGPSRARPASSLELFADPAARKLAGLRVPEIGKLLVFVTQQSVRDLKSRLDPQFNATDADVKACTTLDARERVAWDAFFFSWRTYRASEEGFWSVTSEYDNGLVFEAALQKWQSQLDGRCRLSAPRVTTGDDAGPDLSAVKWAAAAVIAVAVVWGVRTVIK